MSDNIAATKELLATPFGEKLKEKVRGSFTEKARLNNEYGGQIITPFTVNSGLKNEQERERGRERERERERERARERERESNEFESTRQEATKKERTHGPHLA